MVLFLTDGRPTIGKTSEKTIRELAKEANPHKRRIFTFGVGVDVNSPLLENLAFQSRGTSTFVLPDEDIEVKIARVFERLAGPALANPTLKVLDENGKPAHGRVSDMLPVLLPDLFHGDQLVLLGRYTDNKPVKFQLSGNYFGQATHLCLPIQIRQGDDSQCVYSPPLGRAKNWNARRRNPWPRRRTERCRFGSQTERIGRRNHTAFDRIWRPQRIHRVPGAGGERSVGAECRSVRSHEQLPSPRHFGPWWVLAESTKIGTTRFSRGKRPGTVEISIWIKT